MRVCNNQLDFNKAFREASVNYEEKKLSEKVLSYSIIHIVFLIWGILLAFRSTPDHRLIHITLAVVFGPAYVIAYYINMYL